MILVTFGRRESIFHEKGGDSSSFEKVEKEPREKDSKNMKKENQAADEEMRRGDVRRKKREIVYESFRAMYFAALYLVSLQKNDFYSSRKVVRWDGKKKRKPGNN